MASNDSDPCAAGCQRLTVEADRDNAVRMSNAADADRIRLYEENQRLREERDHWRALCVGEVDTISSLEASEKRSYAAFKMLHAIYHERDFRVRIADRLIDMTCDVLAYAVGSDKPKDGRCPACAAGFDFFAAYDFHRKEIKQDGNE